MSGQAVNDEVRTTWYCGLERIGSLSLLFTHVPSDSELYWKTGRFS